LVKTIAKENLHLRRHQYFLMLFYLFVTIFLSNLVGLIPYSFTPTSSFMMTFFLALGHFIGINFIAVTQTRWETVNFFLPSGIPTIGAPFLVLIEFISYVARVFSLSTRLFANMMSGHALLKILASFSWSFLKTAKPISVLAVIPWITVTAITTLEFLVAFLQAYVFTILITIYTSDVLSSH
jgi:ATP synthase subunit 6